MTLNFLSIKRQIITKHINLSRLFRKSNFKTAKKGEDGIGKIPKLIFLKFK